jgi:hypothetical protein
MSEFPEDLNYGVTLGDPTPQTGPAYTPPKLDKPFNTGPADAEVASL